MKILKIKKRKNFKLIKKFSGVPTVPDPNCHDTENL